MVKGDVVHRPVSQADVKRRDVANECTSPSTVCCIVIDIVYRLDDKLADLAISSGDIAVIQIANPLAIKHVYMSTFTQFFVAIAGRA